MAGKVKRVYPSSSFIRDARTASTEDVRVVPWSEMTWLNPPAAVVEHAGSIEVRAAPSTDYWRITSYGFIRDDGHFLGSPIEGDLGVELSFSPLAAVQFDQAGLMLRQSAETWLKAGVELTDGQLLVSCVVTHGRSDWAVSPVPVGADASRVTIRLSRTGDAVTVRYGFGPAPEYRLLRLTHMPAGAYAAGPYCCSPVGPGLDVTFEALRIGPPDARLHPEETS